MKKIGGMRRPMRRSEVQGDGSAEIRDDGSISIDFAYHNGDKALLKAVREPSSAA